MRFAAVSVVAFFCLVSTVLSAALSLETLKGLFASASGDVTAGVAVDEDSGVASAASDVKGIPLIGLAAPGTAFALAIPSPTM